MDALVSKPAIVVALVGVLLVALLGVQAVGAQTAPPQPATATGKLLGNAGFAYLGGVRVFAAAVLWNRLEPQFHEFYVNKSLDDLTFLMPSLYLIQRLDPSFVQSYYNAAFILGKRGQWDDAFRVAKEGIANNPRSGLMRANYIQLLLLQDKKANLDLAYEQAVVGVAPSATYDNIDDEYESLAVFRAVFDLQGRQDLVSAIQQRLEQLEGEGAQATGLEHDHDGNGQPDH